VIEVRSTHALLPIRVLRSRDRTGSYLISLCVGAALFGMFFFLTIFVQDVWGYSPLKTGIAFLPITAMIILASGIASQAVPRIGARPLMIAGSAIMAGGMFWLSRITEHSSYAGGLLGPMLIAGAGLGLLFVPMALVSLTKVRNADTGVASSLVNVGQQVGGPIGLACSSCGVSCSIDRALRRCRRFPALLAGQMYGACWRRADARAGPA
jgi:predicted MFS family arabinose efflux permease